jgi:hypothetical protein
MAALLGAAPERMSFNLMVGTLLFLDQIKREKGVWWMPRQ